MWSISPASILVSSTSLEPRASSDGNATVTILSRSALSSPALNLYVRHTDSRQFSPAHTEFASLVLINCRVMSIKSGHFLGKSCCNIVCRIGRSCWRIWCCDDASRGNRRRRKGAFSGSGIDLWKVFSSGGAQPRVTRFLRYTTAMCTVSKR